MVAPSPTALRPRFAEGFYPGEREACLSQLTALLESVRWEEPLPDRPLGGLVPHAGWVYSGRTAAHLWLALAQAVEPPDLLVLFGAVHRSGVGQATLGATDSWSTPLGPVPLDRACGDRLVDACGGRLVRGSREHEQEHSLEVQLPFIRHLFPDLEILPIAVPADDRAVELGSLVGKALACEDRRVACVASSDLTHYGARYGFAPAGSGPSALAWGRANDDRLVTQALLPSSSGVLSEARLNRNACGAGALAACIEATAALGCRRARLLHQCNSWDARPVGKPELFVGYASVLYS